MALVSMKPKDFPSSVCVLTQHLVGTITYLRSKCLGFLNRCKKYFTPSDLALIYKVYIRPKLEYNAHIWSGAPKNTLHLLDRIQKRAIRLIGGNNIAESLDVPSRLYPYFIAILTNEVSLPTAFLLSMNSPAIPVSPGMLISLPLSLLSDAQLNIETQKWNGTTRIWNALPSPIFPAGI